MGRRIEITDKDIDQIRTCAGYGLTIDKIAMILSVQGRRVSETTLTRWKKENSAVQQAFQEGLALAELQVAKTLFQMATIEKNLTALIWWEKTRVGRRDISRQEVHHSADPNSGPQVVVYLPSNGRDDDNAVPDPVPPVSPES